jgi:Gluconate 2-dehydrogenase subunit 3
MHSFSRRTFLASLAASVPLATIARRAHAAAVVHLQTNPATLDALAEVLLPSTLGQAGFAAEVAAFRDWSAGYRASAELNHGYGTSRLRSTGPTPATRWAQQLDGLDREARDKHQRTFHELGATEREAIVRAALAGERLDRMTGVAEANHVAVALLVHFYSSPAATNLCYQANIGVLTCRPLATSARKPLPMLKVSER